MPLKSHKQICSNIIKLLRVSALNGLLLQDAAKTLTKACQKW